MNVAQLIEQLKVLDQEAIVVISSDPEGNNFSLFADYGTGNWDSNEGEVYAASHSPDDCCMDQEEYDQMRTLPKCVVLWP